GAARLRRRERQAPGQSSSEARQRGAVAPDEREAQAVRFEPSPDRAIDRRIQGIRLEALEALEALEERREVGDNVPSGRGAEDGLDRIDREELTSSACRGKGSAVSPEAIEHERTLPARSLDFWFDYTCPWAYLGSTQARAVAARMGVPLVYRPLLLGGVFR